MSAPFSGDPNEPLSVTECLLGALALLAFLFILGVCGGIEDAAGAGHARPCVVDRAMVQGVRADAEQREMISRVHARATSMRVSRKVQLAAGATIIVESWARNLRHGDLDSVGLYQIRKMHVRRGERDWRRDPERATSRWFVSRAVAMDRPDLTVGRLSQKVQVSAHPGRYSLWVGEARRNYLRWVATCG